MPTWEEFQQQTEQAAQDAADRVRQIEEETTQKFKDLFAQAQEAAINAREDNQPRGETLGEYRARVAAVPGVFSDDNRRAVDVLAASPAGQVEPAAPVAEPEPGSVQEATPVATPLETSIATTPVAPVQEPAPAAEVPAPQESAPAVTPVGTAPVQVIEPEVTSEPVNEAPVASTPEEVVASAATETTEVPAEASATEQPETVEASVSHEEGQNV